MAFKMNLWKVKGEELKEIQQTKLDSENRLEDWIENDSSLLGIEVLFIGRQVSTDYGGIIDLLGINREGELIIIELKRDKTPRDVVAQILDYASWVKDLTYKEISAIASAYLNQNLSVAFSKCFGEAIPDKINTNHRMIIVASELDDSSERIVQYLSEEHSVNINVVFFAFFKAETEELIGRAWLMDPEEVQKRSEAREQPPWTGFWFVNVGEGDHRNWDDNCRYGYIGAGQGEKYSRPLKNLKKGDKIFGYMSGLGYVGFGKVVKEAVIIKEFTVEGEQKTLLELDLKAPKANENSDNSELSEWVVGVKWIKTFSRDEAKTFKGIFSNRHVVCKLRHQETIEFLKREFELEK